MAALPKESFQNITLRLSKETLYRARILAAQRSTSISGLLTAQIERVVAGADEYEAAMRSAMGRIERGFHLGGTHKLDRNALHER